MDSEQWPFRHPNFNMITKHWFVVGHKIYRHANCYLNCVCVVCNFDLHLRFKHD